MDDDGIKSGKSRSGINRNRRCSLSCIGNERGICSELCCGRDGLRWTNRLVFTTAGPLSGKRHDTPNVGIGEAAVIQPHIINDPIEEAAEDLVTTNHHRPIPIPERTGVCARNRANSVNEKRKRCSIIRTSKMHKGTRRDIIGGTGPSPCAADMRVKTRLSPSTIHLKAIAYFRVSGFLHHGAVGNWHIHFCPRGHRHRPSRLKNCAARHRNVKAAAVEFKRGINPSSNNRWSARKRTSTAANAVLPVPVEFPVGAQPAKRISINTTNRNFGGGDRIPVRICRFP